MINLGGFSSRFWMLRKHFNSIKPEDYANYVPFYSWECLTIDIGSRDVDLVIRSEKNMESILKFFISKMRTLDGLKGSANKLLDKLNNDSFENYKKEHKCNIIKI